MDTRWTREKTAHEQMYDYDKYLLNMMAITTVAIAMKVVQGNLQN